MLRLSEIGTYLVTNLPVTQFLCFGASGEPWAFPRAVLWVFAKGDGGAVGVWHRLARTEPSSLTASQPYVPCHSAKGHTSFWVETYEIIAFVRKWLKFVIPVCIFSVPSEMPQPRACSYRGRWPSSSWPWCEWDPALSSKLADCDNEGSGHCFHGRWGRPDGHDPAAPTLLANLWHPGELLPRGSRAKSYVAFAAPLCQLSSPHIARWRGKVRQEKGSKWNRWTERLWAAYEE